MRFSIVLLLSLSFSRAALAAEPVTVSAAVSLKESLTKYAPIYERLAGQKVQFNFGATGHLLAQIREGAPVDAFISASDAQMDQAYKEDLIDAATRRQIVGNEMVLIVPHKSKLTLRSFEDLAKAGVKRLAIGQPKTVPAGEYAVQILRHLKLESQLSDRIVYGESVRQVLAYVTRGEVDAGIVYATDAKEAGKETTIIARAEPDWHERIRYVGAVVLKSKHAAEAKRFLDALEGEQAQGIFAAAGFTPLPPPQYILRAK